MGAFAAVSYRASVADGSERPNAVVRAFLRAMAAATLAVK